MAATHSFSPRVNEPESIVTINHIHILTRTWELPMKKKTVQPELLKMPVEV